MKIQRLTRLKKIIERFESLKADLESAIEPHQNDIGDAKSDLTTLREELQESFDKLSDRAQESDRGERAQSEITSLAEADDKLEEAMIHCTELVNEIDNAIGEMREATGDDL